MARERLDLTENAPSAVHCEACRDRFVDRLRSVRSVRSVRSYGRSLEVEIDGTNGGWMAQARSIGAGVADGLDHAELTLGNLDCPGCADEIADAVNALPGVHHANASFTLRQLRFEFDPKSATVEGVAAAVRGLGFLAQAPGRRLARGQFPWRLLATGALFLAGLLLRSWIPLLAVVIIEGRPIFLGGIGSLRRRSVSMNVLMSVAILGAAGLRDWGEAAAIAWLSAVGAALQDWATRGTRSALDSLLTLSPQTARVSGTDEIPTEQVAVGMTIEVHAGERFPLDGEVIEGFSDANEAPITGESLPVPKSQGSTVFAGAINLSGTLLVRVTRAAANTTLARMIRLIEEAQERRMPVQSTIDRFAAIYTPVVVALAAGIAVIPPLFFAVTWLPWIERGLWLLIVSCPCALIISTPVAIVSAIGAASRMGALIKGGIALDALARVRAVVFDKTGTLTHSRLHVVRFQPSPESTDEELAMVAGALSQQSGHPVSQAIRRSAASSPAQAKNVIVHPGRGVEGIVDDKSARMGSPAWMGTSLPLDAGEIGVLVQWGNRMLGSIILADTARSEGKDAVQELSALHVQEIHLLSGDTTESTGRIAAGLGIAEWAGGLLPDQKQRRVMEIAKNRPVLMVGDGINDLPAMEAATVSMAMGVAGTAAAIEHADIVLMSDNLLLIPDLIRHGRRTVGIMRQNIGIALLAKIVLIALAVPFALPLWIAVIGDVGVSVLVTANAARLLLTRVGRCCLDLSRGK